MMKRTTCYLSFLLVLLVCAFVLFTSCNVGETVEGKREEESSTIKLEYQDPAATEDVAAFMLEQAKIQFKGVPWGTTPAQIAEYMKTQDCLLQEDSTFIQGRERIEAFYEQSKRGEKGFITVVTHYLDDEDQPADKESIYLHLIHFDGALYHLIVLDQNGEQSGTVESFPHLVHDAGHDELYWGSQDYSHYFLTYDESLTMDRIMRALVSSSAVDTKLISSYAPVCSEYTNRVEKDMQ